MRVSKLKRWDAAEHLKTAKAQQEYLNMVLADGNANEVRDALNVIARARGMAKVAKAAGVSREGLYKALGKNGNPGGGTLLAVVRAFGMKLEASSGPKKRAGKKRDVA
jgi:probable addiction module antidote protein